MIKPINGRRPVMGFFYVRIVKLACKNLHIKKARKMCEAHFGLDSFHGEAQDDRR
jgi:hypothetical protein